MTGKWGLAIARSNPKRVYALIETGDGFLTKGRRRIAASFGAQTMAAETWKLVSYDRSMGGRTHYYFRLEVSPDNENEVHFLNNPYSRSIDGGQTRVAAELAEAGGGGGGGLPPVRVVIIMTSGSIRRSRIASPSPMMPASAFPSHAGVVGRRIQLPNGQLYHVTTRQSNSLLRLRQSSGWTVLPRAQPHRYSGFGAVVVGGGGVIPRSAWINIAGRREWLVDSRSGRQ
jgi:hypothetical protein